MWNPMRDTVTCTPDILIQFPQSLLIADTRLHLKFEIKPPMTTDEVVRPIWNGC